MTARQDFDAFAAGYDAAVEEVIGASGEGVEFFARLKAGLVRAFLRGDPSRILDFGCGIGNTAAVLADAFPAAAIVGADVSSRSVEVAASRHAGRPQMRFHAIGDRLPFADASFDLAFTSCVFHHIAPAEQAHWASELRRVVSPAGALFVFEHNPWNPLTRRVVRECVFDRGVILLRPGRARRLFGDAGFRAEPPRFYFFFPRALAALRPLERALRRVPIGAQYFVVGR